MTTGTLTENFFHVWERLSRNAAQSGKNGYGKRYKSLRWKNQKSHKKEKAPEANLGFFQQLKTKE